MSSDDDRALMERLAALEAEVKADSAVKERAQKAVEARMKAEREAKLAEQQAAAAKAAPKAAPAPKKQQSALEDLSDDGDGLGSALALAKKANNVKQELAKPTGKGEKSWVKSGLASMLLGPLGWLYAGSFREAIPASAGWLAVGAIASKLIPMFLLMPVMMVVLPLSGIAGIMYAVRYNRAGKRQRLFGKKPDAALPAGAQKQLAAPKKR